MTQKMIIDVESSKPLNSYGDGHLLIYDNTKKNYFVTTREQFLKEQNNKIKQTNENFESLKKEVEEKLKQNEIEKENFMNEMNKKFNDFLSTYKITNAKTINLIKQFINKEEN